MRLARPILMTMALLPVFQKSAVAQSDGTADGVPRTGADGASEGATTPAAPRIIVEVRVLTGSNDLPERIRELGDELRVDPHDRTAGRKLRLLYEGLPAVCRAALYQDKAPVLGQDEAILLLTAEQGNVRTSCCFAPKVTLASGEVSRIDFEIDHRLAVCPRLMADGRSIELTLVTEDSEAGEAVGRHVVRTRDGDSALFRFGPWIEQSASKPRGLLDVSRIIPGGGSPDDEGPQCLLFLVTTRLVDESEADVEACPTQ